MPDIAVARAFTIILTNGESLSYQPGKHSVPEEVANHWWTKLFLAPDGAPPEDIEAPTTDERGVQFLVQRAAAAEEVSERLRAELKRITDSWLESDNRSRQLEGQLKALGREVEIDHAAGVEHRTALEDMTAQRDAALARVQELEASVNEATVKVQGMTGEMQASTPEEDSDGEEAGEFKLRRRGKVYDVLKADGEVVAEGLARGDARARLAELNGAQ